MPYLEAASSKPRSLRYMDVEESKYLPTFTKLFSVSR